MLFTYSGKMSRNMIFNNVICVTSKGSDQLAHMHTCSLIKAFASRLNIL